MATRNWAAFICMWYESDLKTTSKLKGLTNFDNFWKKSRFEKKVKHLKGIDQSSNGKGYDGKPSKNKWKSFKKRLKRMEKRASMEHQNPILWVVVKRRGINMGSKSFGGNFFLNSSTKRI